MKKTSTLTLLFALIAYFSFGQQRPANYKSVMQQQWEKYSHYHFTRQAQWDSLYQVKHPNAHHIDNTNKSAACTLTKRVFGWSPYWNSTTEINNYNYSLLSDLSYFSYDVDATTGGYTSIHSWTTTPAVTNAENAGDKVSLCATLFSNHATFLGSSTAINNFISTIIPLVKQRNANGVNIDFEGIPSSQSANFTSFMKLLCDSVHAEIPGGEVSIALPAVNWSSTIDVGTLNSYVDLFIIMGYDYYYGGSANAGPVSPKNNGNYWSAYDCSRSVVDYLHAGVSRNKLCLGVPYYGYDWPTSSSALNSTTTGSGSAVLYKSAVANAQTYGRLWDNYSSTPHYSYQSGGQWHQCFYDDAVSLGDKYDMVNIQNIAGIGIWALGYDDGYTDCWNAIENHFTTCAPPDSCSGTMTDMGGPGNYYNNEDWTYTIAPPGSQGLSMNFSSFATEAGYDTLFIYDGPSTASPLIGSYTGTTGPGTVTGTTGSLTLHFKSDGATNNTGWTASWNCTQDNVAPTTAVSVPNSWETQNFTASFTDADNAGGSGLEKSYYQVLEYTGSQWTANYNNGFFSDNFDSVVNPEWTSVQGTWSIATGGYLEQSDQTNGNTNIYAPLTQNLSNRYVYDWDSKIDGTGTNRRAGLHFFCDQPDSSNRGNSYFVYFRVDQSELQFYKVTNNAWTLEKSVALTVAAGTWYEYTVIYDRVSGKMDVYVNKSFVASWTDPSPLSNGSYISFRSGNCDYMVNNLKVYRSRYPSVTVSVGPASTNDVQYQNPNPSTPACRVKSMVEDSAENLSAIAYQDVNIDWTPPATVTQVNDGTGADIDTTYSTTQLSANWTASSDTNSGITEYRYAIGTAPGDSDLVGWTSNGANTSVTATGLSLSVGTRYYFSIKAVDGAGLISTAANSNGQIVEMTLGISSQQQAFHLKAYPEPFNGQTTISYQLPKEESVSIRLMDMGGKTVTIYDNVYQNSGKHHLVISSQKLGLAKGIYILQLSTPEKATSLKLIEQ